MTSLSVASRMAPEGTGRLKRLVKLFCFYYKTASFLEPLAKYCIKRLPMLYYEGRRLNGLWSPFEGRKYSVSRIGEEAAVCIEWALISLILAGDLPSVGLKEEHGRRSERCIGGRKGS